MQSNTNKAKHISYPLLSWDIFSMFMLRSAENHQKQEDRKLLTLFQKEHKWSADLDQLLSHHYQALVLTDTSQKIQWVNKGFTEMTGYSAHFSIGRTSRFLQGSAPDLAVRQRIRHQLNLEQPFMETVVNYRKNNEEYLCEVRIIPLRNESNELIHFIALENEIRS